MTATAALRVLAGLSLMIENERGEEGASIELCLRWNVATDLQDALDFALERLTGCPLTEPDEDEES